MAARGDRSPERAAIDLARQLGTLLAELGLSEVEVSFDKLRVRVGRQSAPSASPVASPAPAVTAIAGAEATQPPGAIAVEAPMVGTFYRASSPTADPYVQEGDLVKHGQIVCIIEAMKLMNEIEAKVSGRILRIYPENGQPVEYGQPLFLIDPTR
jgi:acetyl-CoA carboxylase biotin carboxyl carrier protein